MKLWKAYWKGAVLENQGLEYANVFNHLLAEGCITSEEAEDEYGVSNLDVCMEFWRQELEDFPELMYMRKIYRCDDGNDDWCAYVLIDFTR